MNITRYKKYLPLIIIIAVGVILRYITIIKYGDFWFDEIFSFIYSQKPWGLSLKYWTWETNPPLHMFILKLWFYIFPANEFWARIPSLIFGSLSVYFLYNFSKRIFNPKIALIAGLMLALHPYHILTSATARGYSLFLMLTIISVDYFFKIFVKKQNNKKNAIIFAFVNTLLLFTHLTSCYIFITQLLIILLNEKTEIKKYLKINILPFLIWLIWAIPAIGNKLNSDVAHGAWFFNIPYNLEVIVKTVQLLIFGPIFWQTSLLFFIILLLSIILILIKQKNNNHADKNFFYLLLFVFLPIIIAACLQIWSIKFIIVALPFITLLSAYSIVYFTNKLPPLTYLSILIALLPGLFSLFFVNLPVNNWGDINKYVGQNINKNKKQIFIYNSFIFKPLIDRYYNQSLVALPYFQEKETDWDEAIIKRNFIRFKHEDKEVEAWIKNNQLDNYDEILILNNDYVGVHVPKILEKQGWRLKTIYPLCIPELDGLLLYTKKTTN